MLSRPLQRRHFGSNPNDIKKRITGTQSIKKITKSMQMVSAAKLRGDETRLANGIKFGRALLPLLPEKSFTEEDGFPDNTGTKNMVAVISTDKGLCGGINSYATKMTRNVHAHIKEATGEDASVLVFGGKSEGQLKRTHGKYVTAVVDECWKQPMNFAVASGMATELLDKAKDCDQISLVFNSYVSKIKYDTTVQRIPNFLHLYHRDEDIPAPLNDFEMEPEQDVDTVENFSEFATAAILFGACLDNATSEQSSRMQAMDNATKNAGEMIDKLLLQYNRARQSRITTELIEIISGAESLQG